MDPEPCKYLISDLYQYFLIQCWPWTLVCLLKCTFYCCMMVCMISFIIQEIFTTVVQVQRKTQMTVVFPSSASSMSSSSSSSWSPSTPPSRGPQTKSCKCFIKYFQYNIIIYLHHISNLTIKQWRPLLLILRISFY